MSRIFNNHTIIGNYMSTLELILAMGRVIGNKYYYSAKASRITKHGFNFTASKQRNQKQLLRFQRQDQQPSKPPN